MPSPLSFIIPYYNQPWMLYRQLAEINQYPPEVQVIIVDDGSPEPALPVVSALASAGLREHLRLYRIMVDVPWARSTVRNLGGVEAQTDWLLFTDTDHILPADCIAPLLAFDANPRHFYRFTRYRKGRADETRRKDALPPECEFGPVKPHGDSFLMTRSMFLSSPYDEDYNGCLGGGTPFQHRMEKRAIADMLPDTICLHVYTRAVIPDASIQTLSRDTSEYMRRRRAKERTGNTEPTNIVRLPWERVL